MYDPPLLWAGLGSLIPRYCHCAMISWTNSNSQNFTDLLLYMVRDLLCRMPHSPKQNTQRKKHHPTKCSPHFYTNFDVLMYSYFRNLDMPTFLEKKLNSFFLIFVNACNTNSVAKSFNILTRN
jgi:hypothetical protein